MAIALLGAALQLLGAALQRSTVKAAAGSARVVRQRLSELTAF